MKEVSLEGVGTFSQGKSFENNKNLNLFGGFYCKYNCNCNTELIVYEADSHLATIIFPNIETMSQCNVLVCPFIFAQETYFY